MVASYVERRAVPLFCTLTVALSFGATLLPLPADAVPVVLVFIPALVALGLTAITDGSAGVRTLAGKLAQWRMRPSSVVIALGLGLAMRLAISVVAVALGWIPAIQLRPWSPMQLLFFAAVLFVFALPEELGWRGYALPRLLTRYAPLMAALIGGVPWGVLHLALHMPGMIYQGLPLLPVVLQVTSLSVIATWLYLRSGGNVVLTSLFHAAQSFFVVVNEGIGLTQLLWLMAAVYGAVALLVALVAGARFARRPAAPLAAL